MPRPAERQGFAARARRFARWRARLLGAWRPGSRRATPADNVVPVSRFEEARARRQRAAALREDLHAEASHDLEQPRDPGLTGTGEE